MIINILFYSSLVMFKGFGVLLIVGYWALLVSPNLDQHIVIDKRIHFILGQKLVLNHGDDLISHLSNFKNGVQVLSTTTYCTWDSGSGVIGGGVVILLYPFPGQGIKCLSLRSKT